MSTCPACDDTGTITVVDFTGDRVLVCACIPADMPAPPSYATIQAALLNDPPPLGMAERHAALALKEHRRLNPPAARSGNPVAVVIVCLAVCALFVIAGVRILGGV